MTAYINWMALTQPSKDGTLPMEGNAVSNYESVATGGTSAVAPQGTQYATVMCDANSKIVASVISLKNQADGDAIYNSKEVFCSANYPAYIPNVVVGVTTLTITEV